MAKKQPLEITNPEEWFFEAADWDADLEEDIEKHDELNPKLFENNMLKSVVREAILAYVKQFTDSLAEDGLECPVKDIILLGSNANYNYTKDSDLDIHILLEQSQLDNDLYPKLFDAYRRLFMKKYSVQFFGIPVELYIEEAGLPAVSSGIYSVLNDDWVREPVQQEIPDLDQEAFDKAFEGIKQKFLTFADSYDKRKVTDEDAETFIGEIYTLRQSGLKDGGEWSLGNLLFKEFRNCGYLDNLKDMKNVLTSERLSLQERLDALYRRDALSAIARIAHTVPQIMDNGHFYIHNVNEDEIDDLLQRLKRLDFVTECNRGGEGSYNFNRMKMGLPTRRYTVLGKIKPDEKRA